MPGDPGTPSHRGARHVVVIGGGVSGLLVARDLARAGIRVTVCEASHRFGGRILAAEAAGATFDVGAEAFATRGGSVAALLGELGLSDRVMSPAPLGSWLVAASDAAAIPLPPAGAMGIPAKPLGRDARRALGLRGSVRAALEPLLPASVGRQSTTLAELVRARAGSAVLDRLVRPVTLGVSSAPPERIPLASTPALTAEFAQTGSLIRAAGRLRDSAAAAGGAVASLRGGMSELVAALIADCVAAGVVLRTETPIRALAEVSDVVRNTGQGHPESTDTAEVTDTVLAIPEAAARAILGQPATEPTVTHVEVIALVLDAAHAAVRPLAAAPRGTGALVAASGQGHGQRQGQGQGQDQGQSQGQSPAITAKALTHITRKWPEAERPASEIVRLSYGRAGSAPETTGLDDAAAVRLALRDASRILGTELPGDAVLGFARQPWEMPVRGDREAPLLPVGVHLIGDWITGVGFAALVPAARELARKIELSVAHHPHHQNSERP